jgi:hypothetical protein
VKTGYYWIGDTLVLIALAALAVLGWILVNRSDRSVWRVQVTPEGLTLWPAGELVSESLPWSDLEAATLMSWAAGPRTMRTLRLQVRGQRRRIGIREHVPGIQDVQQAIRSTSAEPMHEEFSYWRTWLPFAPVAVNISFNGVLQLVVRGYVRRDHSSIETVLWSVLLLACSGVAAWLLLRVRRARQASQ